MLVRILLLSLLLGGCASKHQSFSPMDHHPMVEAKPNKNDGTSVAHFDEYIVPNNPAPDAVLTSSGFGNSPALVATYQKYLASGAKDNVEGEGITTLAYSPYGSPLMTCAPLQLCQIILEKGEVVQDMAAGDPTRWQLATMTVGDQDSGDASMIITVKPNAEKMSTTLTITTDKRLYRFRLLADKTAESPTVNFWYPEDTLKRNTRASQKRVAEEKKARKKVATPEHFSLEESNFNYRLKGDNPRWKPAQAFDNGMKTFILFPTSVASSDLPVAFASVNGKQALVNYRFKMPYMILDGVYKEIILVSGGDKNKAQLTVINHGFKG